MLCRMDSMSAPAVGVAQVSEDTCCDALQEGHDVSASWAMVL